MAATESIIDILTGAVVLFIVFWLLYVFYWILKTVGIIKMFKKKVPDEVYEDLVSQKKQGKKLEDIIKDKSKKKQEMYIRAFIDIQKLEGGEKWI